ALLAHRKSPCVVGNRRSESSPPWHKEVRRSGALATSRAKEVRRLIRRLDLHKAQEGVCEIPCRIARGGKKRGASFFDRAWKKYACASGSSISIQKEHRTLVPR